MEQFKSDWKKDSQQYPKQMQSGPQIQTGPHFYGLLQSANMPKANESTTASESRGSRTSNDAKWRKDRQTNMRKYSHGMTEETFKRLVKLPVFKTATDAEGKEVIEMTVRGEKLVFDSQRYTKPDSTFQRFKKEWQDEVRLKIKLADTLKPVNEQQVNETVYQMWKGDEKLLKEYGISNLTILQNMQEEAWKNDVAEWEAEVKVWLDYVEPKLQNVQDQILVKYGDNRKKLNQINTGYMQTNLINY